MSDADDWDLPVIESRRRRLIAYLRHNGSLMVVDAAILAAWLVVTTAVFRWLALPSWLLYVVVFSGLSSMLESPPAGSDHTGARTHDGERVVNDTTDPI
jgi:hypothetical protein